MAPVDSLAGALAVEVLYGAGPHAVDTTALKLAAGSRVADAVAASGVLARHGLRLEGLSIGVWNRVAAAETPLRDGDRIELYRPLQVDPKEARRQRHARQMPPRKLRREREAEAAVATPEPGADRA